MGSAITAESLCQEYRVRDPSLLIARERLAAMSALPPKADIGSTCQDVRFVPKADIGDKRWRV
jgi:hypothetical protein